MPGTYDGILEVLVVVVPIIALLRLLGTIRSVGAAALRRLPKRVTHRLSEGRSAP